MNELKEIFKKNQRIYKELYLQDVILNKKS